MRIQFVCDNFQPLGGTEQYTLGLVKALEIRGHTVAVITSHVKADRHADQGRIVRILPGLDDLPEHASLSRCNDLERHLAEFNPDVVYIQNVANYQMVSRLSALRPTVRFVHDHYLYCPRGSGMYPFGRGVCSVPCGIHCYINTVLRLCLIRPPGVRFRTVRAIHQMLRIHRKLRLLVASDYMRRRLVQNGLNPGKISVLPYFSTYEFAAMPKYGDFMLFAGRMVPEKGLPVLLASMSNWPPELSLKIAGDGPFLAQYKALTNNLGLTDRVEFLGAIPNDQLQFYFQTCLAVVVPSVWGEPFAIVGLEAMVSGKAVVAFNVGGIPEWLTEGETGYLVSPKDKRALAERISRLHHDRELAKVMGERGRERYQKDFSLERHVSKLEEVFNTEVTHWSKSAGRL